MRTHTKANIWEANVNRMTEEIHANTRGTYKLHTGVAAVQLDSGTQCSKVTVIIAGAD